MAEESKDGNDPARVRRAHSGLLIAAAAPPALSAQARTAASAPATILDIADWSYYWYSVERVKLARGTLINGTQMFVEHWIPTVVRHPYSVVLVHGGYGQA